MCEHVCLFVTRFSSSVYYARELTHTVIPNVIRIIPSISPTIDDRQLDKSGKYTHAIKKRTQRVTKLTEMERSFAKETRCKCCEHEVEGVADRKSDRYVCALENV